MFTKAQQLIKEGFSFTNEGHEHDRSTNKARAIFLRDLSKADHNYRVSRSMKNSPDFVTNAVDGWIKDLGRNKSTYLAAKHQKGENSYNPFKGYTDKSYEENRGIVGV
jgi:hypothetical protein